MAGPVFARELRAAFALLIVIALTWNLRDGSLTAPGFEYGNFFSYFTNLSNIFAAGVLLYGAVAMPSGPRWELVRGAATFCMAVTGVVYLVLLSGDSVGVTDEWVNTVIHRVMPIVMVLDFLLFPAGSVGAGNALKWLAIPLVYLGYSLIRGPLTGDWYPYDFIDPTGDGSYGEVAVTSVVLAVCMAALALVLAKLHDRGRA